MPLDSDAVIGRVGDHARALGVFDEVLGHEPKNAPGSGLTLAIWIDQVDPVLGSGLSSTSARVVVIGRIYRSMFAEPADAIDPAMSNAGADLLGSVIGDLTLKGPDGSGTAVARTIDVRGIEGIRASARGGYLEQDRKLFRIFTVTIPVIVNDVWPEAV